MHFMSVTLAKDDLSSICFIQTFSRHALGCLLAVFLEVRARTRLFKRPRSALVVKDKDVAFQGAARCSLVI